MRKIKIIVKDRQAPEVNIFLLIIKLTAINKEQRLILSLKDIFLPQAHVFKLHASIYFVANEINKYGENNCNNSLNYLYMNCKFFI